MKKIIFLLIILGCALFCGCAATADIEYGIDADNTAYTEIKINVDAPYESAMDRYDLQSELRQIERYYRTELGFKSEYSFFTKDEKSAYLILTKTIPADSFEEAFENLKSMLCDESLTVFTELNCELSDTKLHHAYRMHGRVDMHKVLENAYDSGISKAAADYTESLLEYCGFSVTLSLPQNTQMYRLSYTEPTEICYEGKLSVVHGNVWGPAMTRTADIYFKAIVGYFAVGIVLWLILMIVGINMIKKGKRREQLDSKDPTIALNGEENNDQKQDQDTL